MKLHPTLPGTARSGLDRGSQTRGPGQALRDYVLPTCATRAELQHMGPAVIPAMVLGFFSMQQYLKVTGVRPADPIEEA